MFTKLYLDTTNPKARFGELFEAPILVPMIISVLFHTIIYALFCNMVSYIFFGKGLSLIVNKRLIMFLIPIMVFGFIGRFFHVKDIYRAYNGNMEKTRKHLDKLYITWIFIS
jgi:uncharacterized RDD family membrane protein YckC